MKSVVHFGKHARGCNRSWYALGLVFRDAIGRNSKGNWTQWIEFACNTHGCLRRKLVRADAVSKRFR